MKPYLISLDLDGTLLKDNKTISQKNLQAIQKAQELGHQVMIATGRSFRFSEQYYKQLNLSSPIVNFNGAYIHHPLDKKWGEYHTPIDLDIVGQIIHTAEKYNLQNIIAESIHSVYSHHPREQMLDALSAEYQHITAGDLRKTLPTSPTSMLIHTDLETMPLLRKELDDHLDHIHHRSWAVPWPVIEIIKKGQSKATGAKLISEHYNIPKENIIAFVDEDNDLEILQYANYSVAMQNATDDVKEISKYTTKSNEEDGVAIFLNELLDLKL